MIEGEILNNPLYSMNLHLTHVDLHNLKVDKRARGLIRLLDRTPSKLILKTYPQVRTSLHNFYSSSDICGFRYHDVREFEIESDNNWQGYPKMFFGINDSYVLKINDKFIEDIKENEFLRTFYHPPGDYSKNPLTVIYDFANMRDSRKIGENKITETLNL